MCWHLLALSSLVLAAWSPGGGQPASPIRDPGFEEARPRDAWEATVYGAPSRVEVDTAVVHGGRQALRVSAADPSDTALAQEVALKPRAWYRFAGWVRTRGLDPHGAPVYGTLQVQHPGGRGTIAGAANTGGDTDWRQVRAYFRAPADGRVRLCLFFVGFGRGTGTAWFDDIRLDEVNPSMSPITVTRDPLTTAEISPGQYGQFIEYLCDLVPSIWAERLHDGSFEGLSPYGFVYLKETDFKEKPWHPCGATNRATYELDPANPVGGKVCQKIAADGDTPCTVGIAQDGIFADRGEPLVFSCWMRAAGVRGPVTVRLHAEGKDLAACRFEPGAEWAKVRARVVSAARSTAATLSIEFKGPGTLWLDSASLMPEHTVGGWRPDVVEAIRALRPGVIRFGGSVVDYPGYGDYEWRKTIGDPDRRPPFRSWGGLQPAGAGLEEIVQLIRAVGAEPIICVRFNGSTPEEAAAQVQYFNGAAGTPMGVERAKNGHPKPYGIRYWQVGNEVLSADYDTRMAAFCQAMKEADPAIKLMASYPTPAVLASAGGLLDYVCPHHYGCADLAAMQGNVAEVRKMIAENAPGRPIKLGITEWNTTAGDAGPRRAMLWTLANALACSRYHNLMHRNADSIDIACRSNLVNSFCSGIIQVDNHRLYKTPTYYAQQLYATLAGRRPLRIQSEVPADTAPDISATLSEDGRTLTLFAVNDGPDEEARTLDLSAFGHRGEEAAVWTLADRDRAGEPDVTNGFADPERVHAVKSTFHAAGPRFEVRFPPLSLTVLQWRVAEPGR